LQPFNSQNPSIWGLTDHWTIRFALLPNALDRLSRLDNIDKHRVPHAAWTTLELFGAVPRIDKFAPAEFKSMGGSRTYGPLENDAEIGRWRFVTPLPQPWEPDEMGLLATSCG